MQHAALNRHGQQPQQPQQGGLAAPVGAGYGIDLAVHDDRNGGARHPESSHRVLPALGETLEDVTVSHLQEVVRKGHARNQGGHEQARESAGGRGESTEVMQHE